ncbi:MAG: cation:proton antiporter [Planctomycetota bacterium]
MHISVLLPLAAFALAYSLVSKRLDGTPITLPILAVLFGVLGGPSGFEFLHFEMDGEAVRRLAEVALALVLFHDAARIDLRVLRRNASTPARLLGPGLLLTVLAGFLVGLALLPGLSPWEVALLAALLAPTDAALGQAVVTQETVPSRVRQALNVESGLNDGLIVPLVAVFLACAAGEQAESAWDWVGHAVGAVGYGVGAGIAFGWLGGRLLDLAIARDWTHASARRIGAAAVPFVAFFGAEALGGSGFLATFVAGLAMGSSTRRLARDDYDYVEDSGEMLGLLTWVVFGFAAAPAALECGTPEVLGYALLSLTVVRMLPVAIGLAGSGFGLSSVVFMGWFGPRGLASLVFAIGVYGREDVAGRDLIFGVAVWTVLLSVFLHGMSASWLAKRYGARVAEEGDAAIPEFPMPRSRD